MALIKHLLLIYVLALSVILLTGHTDLEYSSEVNFEAISEHQPENSGKINGFLLVFLIVIPFLAGGLIVYIISEKATFSILSKEKEHYLRQLKLSRKSYFPYFIGIVKLLKDRKEYYKTELENFKNQTIKGEIDKLKEQIENLTSENDELKRKPLESNSFNEKKDLELSDRPEFEEVKEVNEKSSRSIYFTIPENDGRFKNANGKSQNDGNCFYRIEFDANTPTGKLSYISGGLDKKAIENIDACLIPVCEIENISNRRGAFRIELIHPGKVYLKNDAWIIDPEKKVKIKLV